MQSIDVSLLVLVNRGVQLYNECKIDECTACLATFGRHSKASHTSQFGLAKVIFFKFSLLMCKQKCVVGAEGAFAMSVLSTVTELQLW